MSKKIREAIPKNKLTADYFADFHLDINKEPLACVLVLAAQIETAVMTMLHAFMIESKETNELFEMKGTLESNSRCVKMAYCLGLIPKAVMDNLVLIARIRNTFAHSRKKITFNEKEVAELCDQLKFSPTDTNNALDKKLVPNSDKFAHICRCVIGYLFIVIEQIPRLQEFQGNERW